jgi:hypothetical protein
MFLTYREALDSVSSMRPETRMEIETFLVRWKNLCLAAFTIAYFAFTGLHAYIKPLWFDELLTVYLSRLPDFKTLWKALADGGDTSPPLTYLLVRLARAAFGENAISVRLPAMIGFWIFCICLFAFVRRRIGIVPAFAALMLPVCTAAWPYAYEARCYGLLLGATGLALLFWQNAVENIHRKWAIAGLTLSLAAATFSHYYGAVLYLPLCGAELWRSFRLRRIDAPIWLAFFFGLLPLPLCYPLLAGTAPYQAHPWAIPHGGYLRTSYETFGTPLIFPAMLFLLGFAVIKNVSFPADKKHIPDHEWVAAFLFTTIPAVLLAAAFLVTRMFTFRYVLPAAAGIVLLIVFAVFRLSRGNAAPVMLLAVASALGCFALFAADLSRPANPISSQPLLGEAIQRGPVVIDDYLLFLQAWYYLPPESQSRVLYLSDPPSAVKYTGTDTAEVNLLAFRHWYPVPDFEYTTKAVPGAALLVYHHAGRPTWLLNRLTRDGARIELLASQGDRALFRATMP